MADLETQIAAALVHLEYLRADVSETKTLVQAQNGRVRTLETDVAALKFSIDTTPSKKDLRNYGAGFGAAGASAVGAIYALWELITK